MVGVGLSAIGLACSRSTAGLSLSHGRADVFRALLERVAYGIRHNIEVMASEEQPIGRVIAVGGGTRSDTLGFAATYAPTRRISSIMSGPVCHKTGLSGVSMA